MNIAQKNLAVAIAGGLIIALASAFAIVPTKASDFVAKGYNIGALGKVVNVAWWDQLNVRKWPASYSRQIGALAPGNTVWIERCINVKNSSDWCKVQRNQTYGWVNSRYLVKAN